MILIAIYTGARFSEIAGLTWDDIDFDAKTITINKTWDYHSHQGFLPTKTPHSVRTIRINSTLLNELKHFDSNQRGQIFATEISTASNHQVNRRLKAYLKTAGIDKPSFHFHSLRHTHVAYLLSQGVDLYAISKRLGHANMSITSNVYAYFIDEYKRKSDNLIESKLDKL